MELTKQQIEEMFHSALCNGLDYFRGYGLELDWYKEKYNEAKQKLDNPCFEDVLMQILKDGGKLYIIDNESSDGFEGSYDVKITLEDVYTKLPTTPESILIDMLEEQDDVETADAILQTVFYGEIIFG